MALVFSFAAQGSGFLSCNGFLLRVYIIASLLSLCVTALLLIATSCVVLLSTDSSSYVSPFLVWLWNAFQTGSNIYLFSFGLLRRESIGRNRATNLCILPKFQRILTFSDWKGARTSYETGNLIHGKAFRYIVENASLLLRRISRTQMLECTIFRNVLCVLTESTSSL